MLDQSEQNRRGRSAIVRPLETGNPRFGIVMRSQDDRLSGSSGKIDVNIAKALPSECRILDPTIGYGRKAHASNLLRKPTRSTCRARRSGVARRILRHKRTCIGIHPHAGFIRQSAPGSSCIFLSIPASAENSNDKKKQEPKPFFHVTSIPGGHRFLKQAVAFRCIRPFDPTHACRW